MRCTPVESRRGGGNFPEGKSFHRAEEFNERREWGSSSFTCRGAPAAPARNVVIRVSLFNDVNGNGRREENEPGIDAREIFLENSNGTRRESQKTNASGEARFVVPRERGPYFIRHGGSSAETPTTPASQPILVEARTADSLEIYFGSQQGTAFPIEIEGSKQDFSIPCNCDCSAAIVGPDTLQMGQQKSGLYTTRYAVHCTDYSPGGWASHHRASDVHWNIGLPATVESKGHSATVLTPPPTKAKESHALNLTTHWDEVGVCTSDPEVKTYNAVKFSCDASKPVLLTSTCQDLKDEIDRLEKELKAKQKELDQSTQKKKELETQYKEKKEKLEGELKKAEQQLKTVGKDLDQASQELAKAEKDFQKAEENYLKAQAEFQVTSQALEQVQGLYQKLTFKERALNFYQTHPGDCTSWAKATQADFINEVFGPKTASASDPSLDTLCAAANLKAQGELTVLLAGALVNLGKLIAIGAPSGLDKGALFEAGVETALGVFVSKFVESQSGKPTDQFDTLPYDQKKKILENLMKELEIKKMAAQTDFLQKTKDLGDATLKVKKLKEKVDALKEKKKTLEETKKNLEKQKKTLEETTGKQIEELKAKIQQLEKEIQELSAKKKAAEEEYQKYCPSNP